MSSQGFAGVRQTLAHRGPDDHGILEDHASGLVLGHLRLSIIDLSAAGHQPIFNEDGTVALSFNGEIYNFQGLRQELLGKGHRFVSATDSEVIVHGYEEWGDAVVTRLCGMFAFALWDSRGRRLLLARDPMGMKPLYTWFSPSGGLFFASEIKAFLALPGFSARPNLRSLQQFLEMNFIYDLRETSLDGVLKLPGGHTLVVTPEDVAASRRPEPVRFYTPPLVEPLGAGERIEERRERLHDTLSEVVKQHLIADVPVGILLSGGLDSSVVASLAARHTHVRTITMAFADSKIDERSFARKVAERIGSTHEEVVIRPQEIAADLPNAVWSFDDLFGDWGLISTALLYRRCREAGVKVVLVGEGSDELFGGYPNYREVGGEAADGRSTLRKTLRLYQGYSGRRWSPGLGHFQKVVRGLYRETNRDFFSTVRLFETRHQLPHHYNMKVDKASMSASVEARVPFLDVRVANEGYRTPRELLLRDGTNKWLLREVARHHDLLPAEISSRPKFGASMAVSWMEEVPGFRQFARDVILDPSGWAGPLGVRRAMEDYFERDLPGYRFPHPLGIFSLVAWRLLLLDLWSRRYLAPAVERGAGSRPEAASFGRVA